MRLLLLKEGQVSLSHLSQSFLDLSLGLRGRRSLRLDDGILTVVHSAVIEVCVWREKSEKER